MRISLYLFLLGLLSGCASGLTKQQCENIDSYKLGKIDGLKGRTPALLNEHLKACPQIDSNLYLEGRNAGIAEYCTPEIAYYQGKEGVAFYNSELCQERPKNNLISEYKKGREVFLLNQQKQELDQQISKKQESYQKDKSVVGDVRRVYHLISGSSPTDSLQKEKNKLNEKILSREIAAPVSTTTLEMENAKISYGMKAGGALLGTMIGFGSGHAFQGRYKSSGWKWTLGESAALGALIASTNKYCKSVPNNHRGLDQATSTQECSNSIPLFTMLGFLGIRIWQSVDLWSNLGSVEYQNVNSRRKTEWTIGIAQNGWPTFIGSF